MTSKRPKRRTLGSLLRATLQEEWGIWLAIAILPDVDILGADLRGARNITVEQIKESKNWEQAIYDDNFRQELGLLL